LRNTSSVRRTTARTASGTARALGTILEENGLTTHGPITQGKLLGRLGAAQRLERLAANQDARTLLTLHTGLARLMDPSGMGARFKALALASPGLAVPVVF